MVWLKNQQLKQCSIEISRHLSHLSLPQLRGLATVSKRILFDTSHVFFSAY